MTPPPFKINAVSRSSAFNDYLVRLRLVQHNRQRSRELSLSPTPTSSNPSNISHQNSSASAFSSISSQSSIVPNESLSVVDSFAKQFSHVSLTTIKQNQYMKIEDLPQDLFELILRYAANESDGIVPFSYWHFMTVSRRFRRAILSLITNVELVRCYDVPNVNTIPQNRPATILQGPLLHCHRLQHLDISGCDNLTDDDVGSFLRHTHALRSFTAVICHRQTDMILQDLANRSGCTLRELDLTGCDRFRHDALFPRNREVFNFQPCDALTNSSLEQISTLCTELRSIVLSKALEITDQGLKSLSKLPHLEKVLLRRLTGISDEGISYLADGHGRLRSIMLMSCGMITDAGLESLAFGHATKRLEYVSVSFNHRVTGRGIRTLVRYLPFLAELNLDNCQEIKDGWCNNVNDHVSSLKRFMFRGVSLEITEQGITDMARIVQFESLDLSYVGTIDANILELLQTLAPRIQTLILEACNKVDDDAARVIAQFSTIRELNISWCSVSSTGLREMVSGPIGKELRMLRVGPLNGNERDTVLCDVGRECTNLEKLILHGEVNEDTIDWLKENTRVVLECNDVVLRRSQRRRIHSYPVETNLVEEVAENAS